MKIQSYVGGHDIAIIQGAVFDPACRKYRGGICIARIPYAGRMLSAHAAPQQELEPLTWEDQQIPLRSALRWDFVDPIPPREECDYALVSVPYVTACRAMGMDTSRLLTIGGSVVDDAGRVIGACWLNRND